MLNFSTPSGVFFYPLSGRFLSDFRLFSKNFRPKRKKIFLFQKLLLDLHQHLIINPAGRFPGGQKSTAMKKYNTTQINSNWKIKVAGVFEGQKVNTLVGVRGFLRMVGDTALAERLLDRAFDCMDDVCVCKLRRGLKISFYAA